MPFQSHLWVRNLATVLPLLGIQKELLAQLVPDLFADHAVIGFFEGKLRGPDERPFRFESPDFQDQLAAHRIGKLGPVRDRYDEARRSARDAFAVVDIEIGNIELRARPRPSSSAAGR